MSNNAILVTKNLKEFMQAISCNAGPIVGIDLSQKAVGIAISDEERKISFPHSSYKRRVDLAHMEKIAKMFLENNVSGIILGLPLDNDGQVRNPRITDMDNFYRTIIKHLQNKEKNICWLLYSERFTTKFSKKSIKKIKKQDKDIKNLEDKIAAQHILSTAIEAMENIVNNNDSLERL